MIDVIDMRVVGVLLASIVLITVIEQAGYVRGGFNGAFWASPLDQRLDRIADRRGSC